MKINEGCEEMLWATASAYIDSFEKLSVDEQEEIIQDMAIDLELTAKKLGYALDLETGDITIIDEYKLDHVFRQIEEEFDKLF